MFHPVNSKANFPQIEENVLSFWKSSNVFKRSIEGRRSGRLFVLYEGPPTANGNPGIHHVLSRVFKDVIPRYKTMVGYHVARNEEFLYTAHRWLGYAWIAGGVRGGKEVGLFR